MADESAAMIRIDAMWLATAPLDMRAGTETVLARVNQVFGETRLHHAYLFTNRRATRMKVLVHDGFGLWLCARRLHRGGFVWSGVNDRATLPISPEQLGALIVGLPWQRLATLSRPAA